MHSAAVKQPRCRGLELSSYILHDKAGTVNRPLYPMPGTPQDRPDPLWIGVVIAPPPAGPSRRNLTCLPGVKAYHGSHLVPNMLTLST